MDLENRQVDRSRWQRGAKVSTLWIWDTVARGKRRAHRHLRIQGPSSYTFATIPTSYANF